MEPFLRAVGNITCRDPYQPCPKGFPGGTSGKEPTCQCRRHKRQEFDPWVRITPWRRKWQPTPVFLPGNPMDREAWWATVHRVTKSWTWLKRLSTPAQHTPDPGPQERFWRSPHCSTSCGPIFFGTGHRCLDCKSSFLCSRQLFKWKAISSKAEKCKYEYEMSVDVIFWIHGFKLVFFAPRGLAVRGSGFTGACPWMELSVDQWKMIVFKARISNYPTEVIHSFIYSFIHSFIASVPSDLMGLLKTTQPEPPNNRPGCVCGLFPIMLGAREMRRSGLNLMCISCTQGTPF